MASIVVPTSGALLLLDLLFKTSSPENLVLKLYKNDYVPLITSTAGSFTEADFTGYTSATLTRATWNSASTVSGVNVSTYPARTFTAASSQVVFGAFVVGASSGSIYFAWRFDTPRNLTSGNSIVITPTFAAA